MIRIKNLLVHNLRAIVVSNLGMKNRGLIIVGDNGTGKSSLVDSFEYFFTGQLKYLSSVQAISVHQSLPHRNSSIDDVFVEVAFDVNGTDVVLSRSGRNDIHPNPNLNPELELYFEEAKNKVVILHRDKILEFVKCQPAERYQILAEILGIEDFRERMSQVKNLKEKRFEELETKKSDVQHLEHELKSITRSIVESQILNSLNERLVRVSIAPQKSIKDIIAVTQKWLETYGVESKKKQCIGYIEHAAQYVRDEKEQLNELNEASMAAFSIIQNHNEIQLQEIGLMVLEKSAMDICPLCETPQNLVSLREKVSKKVQANRQNSMIVSTIQGKENSFIAKMKDVEREISNAHSKVIEIVGSDESKAAIEQLQKYCDSLKSNYRNNQTLDEIEKKIAVCFSSTRKTLNAVPEPAEDQQINSILSNSDQIHSLLLRISMQRHEVSSYEQAYNLSADLFDAYVQSGKDVVMNYLSNMLNELNRYWTQLHPSDPHTNLSLDLQPTRSASTRLTMESFGLAEQDPRAFSSEGHLDSLGICIFLAFVKKFHTSCSLVILDDVVSSIDSNHRQRLADLLFDEFVDKQILITTHEPVWAQSLKSGIEARGIQSEFAFAEILNCTIIAGPQFNTYSTSLERAQRMILEGYHDLAAAASRTYLEGLLRRTCEKFDIELPFRNDPRKIRLRTLLSYFESFVSNRLQQGSTEVNNFQTCITHIKSTAIWGNILQHSDELRTSVTSGEAVTFLESVERFDNTLKCRSCSGPLIRRGSSIVCPHGGCRNPTTISMI